MKKQIIPIIILGIILVFAIVDHKELNRCDKVQTVNETQKKSESVVGSESEFVHEDKNALEINRFETKPIVDAKQAMPTPEESNLVESNVLIEKRTAVTIKSAETKFVAEKTKSEDKSIPTAVPVVITEEAEKLNAENIMAFEVMEKAIAKQKKRFDDGYELKYSEDFKKGRTISLSMENEKQIFKKGYDLDEFKKRQIPQFWNIDLSTIPSDTPNSLRRNQAFSNFSLSFSADSSLFSLVNEAIMFVSAGLMTRFRLVVGSMFSFRSNNAHEVDFIV